MGHVFASEVLADIVRRGVGKPIEENIEFVVGELKRTYPRHIHPSGEWIFSVAGGVMGTMTILHASLSEYVIIFGSAIGTEGHSGRHPLAEIWDFVMDGELWNYRADQFRRNVFKPGEWSHLPRGTSNGSKIPETGGWMLEYGRGNVPSLLPFGLADSVLSTLDGKGVWDTFKTYGKLVTKEILAGKI